MKTRNFRLLIATMLTSFLVISGCSAVPDKLSVSEDTALTDYQSASNQPTQYSGEQARWGGRIIQVKNLPDSTLLDLLHFELNSSGRPIEKDESAGRFRVYVQGYLEPEIYSPGRSLTVLGTVAAPETVRVGRFQSEQPVLHSQEIHLWPVITPEKTEYVYVPYVIRTPVYIQKR